MQAIIDSKKKMNISSELKKKVPLSSVIFSSLIQDTLAVQ